MHSSCLRKRPLLIYFVLMFLVSNKLVWEIEDRMAITVLAAMLLAALLYGWRSGALTQPQACTLVVLLLVFELGNDAGFQFADRGKPAQHAALDKVKAAIAVNAGWRDLLERLPPEVAPSAVSVAARLRDRSAPRG